MNIKKYAQNLANNSFSDMISFAIAEKEFKNCNLSDVREVLEDKLNNEYSTYCEFLVNNLDEFDTEKLALYNKDIASEFGYKDCYQELEQSFENYYNNHELIELYHADYGKNLHEDVESLAMIQLSSLVQEFIRERIDEFIDELEIKLNPGFYDNIILSIYPPPENKKAIKLTCMNSVYGYRASF